MTGAGTPSPADLLAFEAQRWHYAGAKEQAIRDEFGWSPTRYYLALNAAIDTREALEADALTTRRLLRLRDRRRTQARAAVGGQA